MSTESSLRESLANKLTTINHHGDLIRNLKSSHAPKSEIEEAVKALNALKLEKTEIENELKAKLSGESNGNNGFNGMSRDTFRQAVVNTLER
nr:glycine--tRNA ligase, mitochondrial 1-like [Tanacetum cinerariifolium]